MIKNLTIKKNIKLSINRNDFMISNTQEKNELKQVELNTIAVGMTSLSQSAADLHKFVIEQLGLNSNAIPKESISSKLADAFLYAFRLYSQQKYKIEIISKLGKECLVRRLTLDYIGQHAELGAEGELLLYYSYFDEIHWKGRRLVELSRCIKCPSINYHLTGCKKVQQVLASKTALRRFVESKSDLELLFSSMVGQYSLDCDSLGDKMTQFAIENPDKFVMKPQREGGGFKSCLN
ncbi:glutathione synthetase, chloroplastic-like [Octopus sinensis]|uniref:Glutathione synthetase n=1 Tax=Octopus sinensis TaxID=2607531 RepID=A0A6P7U082_9MOLL|nr:glutathione synthetase, chloroplastic-like [Octopus sinensis]